MADLEKAEQIQTVSDDGIITYTTAPETISLAELKQQMEEAQKEVDDAQANFDRAQQHLTDKQTKLANRTGIYDAAVAENPKAEEAVVEADPV